MPTILNCAPNRSHRRCSPDIRPPPSDRRAECPPMFEVRATNSVRPLSLYLWPTCPVAASARASLAMPRSFGGRPQACRQSPPRPRLPLTTSALLMPPSSRGGQPYLPAEERWSGEGLTGAHPFWFATAAYKALDSSRSHDVNYLHTYFQDVSKFAACQVGSGAPSQTRSKSMLTPSENRTYLCSRPARTVGPSS